MSEVENVAPLLEKVERIIRLRQEGTETLRKLWTNGELGHGRYPEQSRLPCHDACEGDILVAHGDERIRGHCPVYMEPGVCPLVELKERELTARLIKAGFGPRYHRPELQAMRCRDIVEEYLAHLSENLSTGKGLLLSGDVGTGKSMVLAYMARQLLMENHGVWAVPMPDFVERLAVREGRKQFLTRALGVEVLMLDDFGAGEMAPWVIGIMEGLVESRYANLLPTFVATNLTRETLTKEPLFRRMVDRWRQTNRFVVIGGASQRSGVK